MRRVIRVQKYSKSEHGITVRGEKSEKTTGMRVMIAEAFIAALQIQQSIPSFLLGEAFCPANIVGRPMHRYWHPWAMSSLIANRS